MDQFAVLPTEALPGYAEMLDVLDVLELAPWNGHPYNKEQPDVPMRKLMLGATARAPSPIWFWSGNGRGPRPRRAVGRLTAGRITELGR